jgi:hypothetical protein
MTWLWYVGCSGIIISSEGEEIVYELRSDTKMIQISERGVESQLDHDLGRIGYDAQHPTAVCPLRTVMVLACITVTVGF